MLQAGAKKVIIGSALLKDGAVDWRWRGPGALRRSGAAALCRGLPRWQGVDQRLDKRAPR